MAVKKAADDDAPVELADPGVDLEKAAIAPALAVNGYGAAVGRAMAAAAENAVALQQSTAELAITATGKSVQMIASAGPHPTGNLDLHTHKEA